MNEPTLSVTVGNFNYGRYLPQAIESILSQTFEDFELMIIDNASTDDSLAVIESYARTDPRIRVVAHASNVGMFASLREACALARGRYRVPVEADDWIIERDAFQAQVEMLDEHPPMAFVFSPLTMTNAEGRVLVVARPYQTDVVLRGEDALEGILSFSLGHTGMMMRMDSFRATQGYSEEVPHTADMMLGVRLAEVGDVGYVSRQLYAFRQHGSNLHLRPQLQVVRREVVPVIDAAFKGPLGSRMADAPAVRRRVLRGALVHLPTQYIFTGQVARGWRLYWESFKTKPILTALQPRTLSLLSRTLLGERGHQWVATRLGRSSVVARPESLGT